MASSPLYSASLLLLLVVIVAPTLYRASAAGGNPTAGFVKVDLAADDFLVQSPYNVPESQRYSFDDGVRQFWVYTTDKPFKSGTDTNPRTEIRIKNHDYSSGVWQFEGYGFVPSGTSGVSVVQIHRQNGAEPATVLMLHVYDGVLRFYSGQAVEDNIYDRWFRLNVVHDVGASTVAVYVDGDLKFSTRVMASESYYLKFGVYMQHHDWSPCMESRWRNVTVYNKP